MPRPTPPWAWNRASVGERTLRCHTFCELVHRGAMHQVAKGVCYRGLLPVPEEEKRGLKSFSEGEQGAKGGLRCIRHHSHGTPYTLKRVQAFSHTFFCCYPYLEPLSSFLSPSHVLITL